MDNNKITINYGRTFNLGNFESARIDVSISETIQVGQDKEKVMSTLFREAKRFVMTEGRKVKE